jgi:hypothetical protein
MTDEELLSRLRSEMLQDAERGGEATFLESVHEKALGYLNEPPADLYHRYMELASLMQASGRGEFSSLVESKREATDQHRRVWIAWLIAAYEHEMGRLHNPNI